MSKLLVSLVIMSLSTISMADEIKPTEVGEMQLRSDRYTVVDIAVREDQLNPLLAISSISFNNEYIVNVGEAINEVLLGSGFRWNDERGVDQSILIGMPLPQITRDLGPMQLRDILITLGGSAWQLKVDELTREVWFQPIST